MDEEVPHHICKLNAFDHTKEDRHNEQVCGQLAGTFICGLEAAKSFLNKDITKQMVSSVPSVRQKYMLYNDEVKACSEVQSRFKFRKVALSLAKSHP